MAVPRVGDGGVHDEATPTSSMITMEMIMSMNRRFARFLRFACAAAATGSISVTPFACISLPFFGVLAICSLAVSL
ncbi:hypothetical protein BLAC_06760 [Bifidobacterium animalis subsp. lactis ATCC 27673]|uniref:hypothetical protein n=2 Tax=Bifidobacterium animalis TaxID=28025 RepID=UPI0003B0FCAA|nr:hypothetical protein [Bifidobacterium animalis]AGW85525.1 hypothetical protein BLAC_06760 [Bifidobacterium animalis subsp. lactis ATCC 27673]KOA44950.1 hypothetical protein BAAA27673_07400 [Bifidobacterium animalis subsp. lactis ATCC 27673]